MSGEPEIVIVRGAPTAAEVAAVTAVLMAAAQARRLSPPRVSPEPEPATWTRAGGFPGLGRWELSHRTRPHW
ncbi:acyl-CoA carboxylase epsilon subunit [Sinosporangium siamense]|uniref:Acyl-CoA carboxylase subunit epsilon n=1 Tax=Sinosporangium siamense TaxID=1367973 RepID=A0A919RB71_9ACTN|nr:acyl-CoA carboxylase epsilon subunit [Sinosporangium siamense]GII90715.1 hypothetical protein Ssi02_09460 [Sinosporangium siamense]